MLLFSMESMVGGKSIVNRDILRILLPVDLLYHNFIHRNKNTSPNLTLNHTHPCTSPTQPHTTAFVTLILLPFPIVLSPLCPPPSHSRLPPSTLNSSPHQDTFKRPRGQSPLPPCLHDLRPPS